MTSRFDDDLERGQRAEDFVADVLCAIGWLVHMPGREGSGRPELRTPGGPIVLPDLDVYRAPLARWAEVKLKAKADWTRCTQQHEHGFALRLRNDYIEIEEATGRPVWLFVYETTTGALLHGLLSELEKHARIYDGHKMDRGGTVFYPRDAFAELAYPSSLRTKHGLPVPAGEFRCEAATGPDDVFLEEEWKREQAWEAYWADCERHGWDPFEGAA